MIRFLALLLCFCAGLSRAHVGSPNVFFEGTAGPYSVRIFIRPPEVLPGPVQIHLRTGDNSLDDASLQILPWSLRNSPDSDWTSMEPLAGEPGSFSGMIWLAQDGSYTARMLLRGPKGKGLLNVPFNSAATRQPVMPGWAQWGLAALGLILIGWGVAIAFATAKKFSRSHRSTPVTIVATSLLFLAAVTALAFRWQYLDRQFREQALSKPLPVSATIRTNGTLRLLHLAPVTQTSSSDWNRLLSDHGKWLHLFLIREPSLDAFAHLHPTRRPGPAFENVLPALPSGEYRLYAELAYDSGQTETLTTQLRLPLMPRQAPQRTSGPNMLNEVFCLTPSATGTNSLEPFALDADDSWHLQAPESRPQPLLSTLMGGWIMRLDSPAEFKVDQHEALRFSVFSPDGKPAVLQPYMGMLGHAVIRKSDGAVFTHLHPVGTVSMATSALVASADSNMMRSASPNTNSVAFPYAFPLAGSYRIWTQIRVDARVLTGVFDVDVK